jgi:hypothetical protein
MAAKLINMNGLVSNLKKNINYTHLIFAYNSRTNTTIGRNARTQFSYRIIFENKLTNQTIYMSFNYKTIFLFAALCCLHQTLWAEKIKGTIKDTHNETVGFATVMIKGTTIGTTANSEGNYELDIPEGNQEVLVQLIGYQSQQKTYNPEVHKGVLDFKLKDESLTIPEVVIKANGEDPAYRIMRQVIAHKKEHAASYKTMEVDVYIKGALRNRSIPKSILGFKLNEEEQKEVAQSMNADTSGKSVLYLLEQMTHYSYQAPNKEANKVLSIRQSGDSKGVGFATMPPITNIYENNITILQGLNSRGFISPASNNAMLYYKFKLLGSYMEGDRLISKIQVTPKRKFEPLFTGIVYVVEQEWVFQTVDLLLTKTSQMDKLDSLRLVQNYIPNNKGSWIINNQILYPTISILGFDIAGNFLTSYSNHKINEPIDPKTFEGNIIASYDSTANDKPINYWNTIRPVPLEDDEEKDFIYKDSIAVVERNKADSLYKASNYNLGIGTWLTGSPSIKVNKNSWSIEPLIRGIGYNTVEGLNFTLQLNWLHRINSYKYWSINLKNRYGFANDKYNVLLSATYDVEDPKHKNRKWKVNALAGQYVFQLNNEAPITPFLNEMYTLWGGRNYMKLYQSRLGTISVDRDWANGFKASLGISYQQRNALFNTADYTFSDNSKVHLTSNQPYTLPIFENHNAAVIKAAISYQPGWKYIKYPKFTEGLSSIAPIFTARYEKGIPNIAKSKSDFDKWSLEIQHGVNLKLLGSINYRILGGGFLNDKYVGIPDMKHLFGNQTFLANPYMNSFQLAPYYKYSNTAKLYGEGHAEWHLNGWLTNKIPGLRQLNYHLVFSSNVLYINKDSYYAEIGIGLENIGVKLFRFGRVDLLAGYESGANKPTIGVRIGLGDMLWSMLGINNSRN